MKIYLVDDGERKNGREKGRKIVLVGGYTERNFNEAHYLVNGFGASFERGPFNMNLWRVLELDRENTVSRSFFGPRRFDTLIVDLATRYCR